MPATTSASSSTSAAIPTDFSAARRVREARGARRLRILPTSCTPRVGRAPTPEPDRPAEGRAVRELRDRAGRRYGPTGALAATSPPRVPVRVWQIWNEPNIRVFWPEQPFHAELRCSCCSAAHARDQAHRSRARRSCSPGCRTTRGASSRRSTRSRAPRRSSTSSRCTRTPGDPNGVITILRKVRQVMNAAGDARKPIIADEISWPSSHGKTAHNTGFDFATTEAGQARKIAALLPLLGAEPRTTSTCSAFDYYTWVGRDDRNGARVRLRRPVPATATTAVYREAGVRCVPHRRRWRSSAAARRASPDRVRAAS